MIKMSFNFEKKISIFDNSRKPGLLSEKSNIANPECKQNICIDSLAFVTIIKNYLQILTLKLI